MKNIYNNKGSLALETIYWKRYQSEVGASIEALRYNLTDSG